MLPSYQERKAVLTAAIAEAIKVVATHAFIKELTQDCNGDMKAVGRLLSEELMRHLKGKGSPELKTKMVATAVSTILSEQEAKKQPK